MEKKSISAIQEIEDCILFNKKNNVPFELMIARLCEKYHKLPEEILEMDVDWFMILTAIDGIEFKKVQKMERETKVREMAKNGIR